MQWNETTRDTAVAVPRVFDLFAECDLAHKRHEAIQVRDRPDGTMLAETQASWVAANGEALAQLVILQSKELGFALGGDGHPRLVIVGGGAHTETAARERHRSRDGAGLQCDLGQEASFVGDIEAVALAGDRQPLRRSADRER